MIMVLPHKIVKVKDSPSTNFLKSNMLFLNMKPEQSGLHTNHHETFTLETCWFSIVATKNDPAVLSCLRMEPKMENVVIVLSKGILEI